MRGPWRRRVPRRGTPSLAVRVGSFPVFGAEAGEMRRGVEIEKDQMMLRQKETRKKREKKNNPSKEMGLQGLIYQKAMGTGPPVGKVSNPRKAWQLPGVGKRGWQPV